MLNESDFKFPQQESKTFDPMPAGVYQVELTDIEERDGLDFNGNPAKQMVFTFTVLDEGEHYGRKLWRQGTKKFSGGTKPSNLFTILSGVCGKTFTKEECDKSHEWLTAGFLNSLVGKQNLVAVSQKAKQTGGMRNVIDSIMPVKQDLPAYKSDK